MQKDDEWLDYDSEKKDYSNLKISTLKIGESQSGEGNEEAEHEVNDEGEKVRVKKTEGGPWNKLAGQSTTPGKNCKKTQRRP